PRLVQPMREELTRLGFQELRTPAEVEAVLGTAKDTTLVVVNSVCGCAARNARPAANLALQHTRRPARLLTVFAGQDADATAPAVPAHPPPCPPRTRANPAARSPRRRPRGGATLSLLPNPASTGAPAFAAPCSPTAGRWAGRRTAGARSHCATGTRAGSGRCACSGRRATSGLPPDSRARRRRTARR